MPVEQGKQWILGLDLLWMLPLEPFAITELVGVGFGLFW